MLLLFRRCDNIPRKSSNSISVACHRVVEYEEVGLQSLCGMWLREQELDSIIFFLDGLWLLFKERLKFVFADD